MVVPARPSVVAGCVATSTLTLGSIFLQLRPVTATHPQRPLVPYGFINASWRTELLVHAQHQGLLRRVEIELSRLFMTAPSCSGVSGRPSISAWTSTVR